MANHPPDVLDLQLRTLPLHRVLLRSIEARLFWELDEELIEPTRAPQESAGPYIFHKYRKPAATDHTAG